MSKRPNKPNKPIYFLAPDHEILNTWEENFELFSQPGFTTLSISIHPEAVKFLDVSYLQEFVIVLQHYPHLIEKFLFSVQVKFPEIPDSELYLPEAAWKNDSQHFRWFQRMSNLGPLLFFLHDNEARFFFIAGDLLADGKLEIEYTPEGKIFINIEGENLPIVTNRIFSACLFFMMYCHATGFNPKFAIESIIANFDAPITFSEINKKYKEAIKEGVFLRMLKEEQ